MVVPPIIIAIHIHALSHRHNCLDLDPTYKDAYGLPLLRMTFDWNGNELGMTNDIDERCTEIGRALYGSIPGRLAFPRNHANGRTRTIGMLACWAADAIKANYGRNPGSLV
jgi:hypothetical protein